MIALLNFITMQLFLGNYFPVEDIELFVQKPWDTKSTMGYNFNFKHKKQNF